MISELYITKSLNNDNTQKWTTPFKYHNKVEHYLCFQMSATIIQPRRLKLEHYSQFVKKEDGRSTFFLR